MMGDSTTFKDGMSPRRMWYRRSTAPHPEPYRKEQSVLEQAWCPMDSRVVSEPRHGDYQKPKAGIRSACSSMRTTGGGLSSWLAECRSVGSMRLLHPSRRIFHQAKVRVPSSFSSPPMLRSIAANSPDWRNVPRWDWRALAPPRATAVETSC